MSEKVKNFIPKSFKYMFSSDLDIRTVRTNQYAYAHDCFWICGENEDDDFEVKNSTDGYTWTSRLIVVEPRTGMSGEKLSADNRGVMYVNSSGNLLVGYVTMDDNYPSDPDNFVLHIRTFTSASASTVVDVAYAGTEPYITDVFNNGTSNFLVFNNTQLRIINFTSTTIYSSAIFAPAGVGTGVVSSTKYYFLKYSGTPPYPHTIVEFDGTTFTDKLSVYPTVDLTYATLGHLCIKNDAMVFFSRQDYFLKIDDWTEFDDEKVRISIYDDLSYCTAEYDTSNNTIGFAGLYNGSVQFWRIGKNGDIYKSVNIPYTNVSGSVVPVCTINNVFMIRGSGAYSMYIKCPSVLGRLNLSHNVGAFTSTYTEFDVEELREAMVLGKSNVAICRLTDYVINSGEYIELYNDFVTFEDGFEANADGDEPAGWTVSQGGFEAHILSCQDIDNSIQLQFQIATDYFTSKPYAKISFDEMERGFVEFDVTRKYYLWMGAIQYERMVLRDSSGNEVIVFGIGLSGFSQYNVFETYYESAIQDQLESIAVDQTIHVKVHFDCALWTYDLYLDDVLQGNYPFQTKSDEISEIYLTHDDLASPSGMCYDNFVFTEYKKVLDGSYEIQNSDPLNGLYHIRSGMDRDLDQQISVTWTSNGSHEKLNDLIDNHCDFLNGVIADDSFVDWNYSCKNKSIRNIIKDIMDREHMLFKFDRTGACSFIEDPMAGTAVLDLNNTNITSLQVRKISSQITEIRATGGFSSGDYIRYTWYSSENDAPTQNVAFVSYPNISTSEELKKVVDSLGLQFKNQITELKIEAEITDWYDVGSLVDVCYGIDGIGTDDANGDPSTYDSYYIHTIAENEYGLSYFILYSAFTFSLDFKDKENSEEKNREEHGLIVENVQSVEDRVATLETSNIIHHTIPILAQDYANPISVSYHLTNWQNLGLNYFCVLNSLAPSLKSGMTRRYYLQLGIGGDGSFTTLPQFRFYNVGNSTVDIAAKTLTVNPNFGNNRDYLHELSNWGTLVNGKKYRIEILQPTSGRILYIHNAQIIVEDYYA